MKKSMFILGGLIGLSESRMIRQHFNSLPFIAVQFREEWYPASVSFNQTQSFYIGGPCPHGLKCLPADFVPSDELLFMEDLHYIEGLSFSAPPVTEFPTFKQCQAPISLGMGPSGGIATANIIFLTRSVTSNKAESVSMYLRPVSWKGRLKQQLDEYKFQMEAWSASWSFRVKWAGISGLGDLGSENLLTTIDPTYPDILLPIAEFKKPSERFLIDDNRLYLRCSRVNGRNRPFHILLKGADISPVIIPVIASSGITKKSWGLFGSTAWCPTMIRFGDKEGPIILGAPAVNAHDIHLNAKDQYVSFVHRNEINIPDSVQAGPLSHVYIYSRPEIISQNNRLKIFMKRLDPKAISPCEKYVVKSTIREFISDCRYRLVLVPVDPSCKAGVDQFDAWSGTRVGAPNRITADDDGIRIGADTSGTFIFNISRGGPEKRHIVIEFNPDTSVKPQTLETELKDTVRRHKQMGENLNTLDAKISPYR